MTGAAAASYEWAVSADGEDWSVVETETDETFDVTADLVGMYVKVTVTAEDEETASDVTTEPVEPVGIIEIESAEATEVNKIEVLLAYSIDPDDTVVTVTKGNEAIPATVAWNDDCDIATITTAAKMTKGTYTVTVSSVEDADNEDSATVEIESQKVAAIVIDTDTALTQKGDKKVAYAHYDVLDQYGESIRTSTSITWAGSATITGNKTTGRLTITKTNGDWVYNEQIYVSGVYTKTGVSVQKTLTVGGEQALDSIEIKGFVKKGTSEIVESLPADFKKATYYILYNALDQNGVQIPVANVQPNSITFVSDNVLVVKSIEAPIANGLTVSGVDYNAAFVEPGINVSKGGLVTVTAIANNTGTKTEIEVYVGDEPVVTSFTMSAPASTVADGDKDVEIPFVALDADGNAITDFVTLAKQETFNKLSFTASEGTLKLAEQNDGTAKLLWTDKGDYQGAGGWTQPNATDGQDRPISLTAVVVNGGTDNEMIYVSDKRRPDAIIAAKVDEVYTEDATITLYGGDAKVGEGKDDIASYESFQFVDQYGKTIKGTDKDEKYGDSTGFFLADSTKFTDQELKGYNFGVRVTYAGSDNNMTATSALTTTTVLGDKTNGTAFTKQAVILPDKAFAGGHNLEFTTSNAIPAAATGEGFKFEIAKDGDDAAAATDAAKWDAFSTTKFVGTAIVDLSQVNSFTVGDLNKFYVGKSATFTGEGQIAAAKLGTNAGELGNDTKTPFGAATGGLKDNPDYQQEVKVTGTWNGKTVTIPAAYYKVSGSKLATNTGALTENKIIKTVDTVQGLTIQDLYDRSTSTGISKNATDTLKATIYNINGDYTGANAAKLVNSADFQYYDVKSGKTATDVAADTTAAVDAILEQKTIAAESMTQTELEAAVDAANTNLATLQAALTTAGKNTAAGAANLTAANYAGVIYKVPVYDTASKDITISDQDPTATTIDGLKDAYTVQPTTTKINNDTLIDKLGVKNGTVKVKDQYGVATKDVIKYRATNVSENKDAYALNNFSVTGNDSATIAFSGAERGDKFDLILSAGGASAQTAITVGADTDSNITGSVNNYQNLINNTLEKQRTDGLG